VDRSVACLVLLASLAVASCVATTPATDTSGPVSSGGSPTAPTTTPTPTPVPTGPLAYTQDMAPIFASDCTPCHSGSRPSANYSMTTYANVMRDVVAGSAASRLVVWTQPGGSMYRYFSVDRTGRADMVKRWVVDNKAAQSR
jgi:hypothetical protein